MALTIQERLKDLRVECGLTLEQLAEQTHQPLFAFLRRDPDGERRPDRHSKYGHGQYGRPWRAEAGRSAALRRRSRTKARWRYPTVKADGRDAAEG